MTPTIAARLDALYEQRADLKEQIAARGREAAPDMEAAVKDKSSAKMIALGMELVGRVQDLEKEIGWIERQILALLGNPGLMPAPVYSPGPGALDPPPACGHCGLPLLNGHILDETIVARGARTLRVHRACAAHLRGEGWQAVAYARGPWREGGS